jgi:hypothetical protein
LDAFTLIQQLCNHQHGVFFLLPLIAAVSVLQITVFLYSYSLAASTDWHVGSILRVNPYDVYVNVNGKSQDPDWSPR